MSAYVERDFATEDYIEVLLGAYASSRLQPVGPALARIRRTVMAGARAAGSSSSGAALAAPQGRLFLPRLRVPARAFALGFAACLSLGIGGSVLAAPPGSLFYDARLVIETATMPSVGNVDARLAAYADQFERRIHEAEAAAQRGDSAGVTAALAAYQAEVSAALAEVGDAPDRLARLQEALTRHVAKLEALAVSLPTAVARENAVDHAINASHKAVEKLKEKARQGNGNPGGGGAGNGNGHANGGGGPGE